MKKCLCIILSVMLFYINFINYGIGIVSAESVVSKVQILDCEELILNVGRVNYCKLSCTFSDENSNDTIKEWSSNNDSCIILSGSGEKRLAIPVAPGKATITVETENGFTDTIDIIVKDSELYQEGEIVETTYKPDDSQVKVYKFIPEYSGKYELCLIDFDTSKEYYGFVFLEGQVWPVKQDRSLSGTNSKTEFSLEKGKTYYVGCVMENMTDETTFSFATYYLPEEGNIPTEEPGTSDNEETIDVITEGIEKQLDSIESGQIHKLMFIPEETGVYKYYSMGSGNIYGRIYNDTNELIGIGNNWEHIPTTVVGNFEIKTVLTAGNTYYLENSLMYANKGTYSVKIEKMEEATNISFGGSESVDCYINDYIDLRLMYTPSDAWASGVKFTSDNPDAVTIALYEDDFAKVFGKAFGSATITVEADSGLTDTIVVNVIDYPEIQIDVKKSECSMNGDYYYKFVPQEDGIYKVSVGSAHNMFPTYVYIYDANFMEIVDVTYTNTITCELTAGEKYYYRINPITDDVFDSVTTIVKKVSDDDLGKVEVLPTVVPTANPDPQITLTPEFTDVPTIEPIEKVTPEPTETDVPAFTKTPLVYTLGDADENGKINAEDSLLVLKHAAKLEILSDDLLVIADINEDESIDAKDALKILKISARIK